MIFWGFSVSTPPNTEHELKHHRGKKIDGDLGKKNGKASSKSKIEYRTSSGDISIKRMPSYKPKKKKKSPKNEEDKKH